MKFLRIAGAAVLTAGFVLSTPLGAAPLGPSAPELESNSLVTEVSGCHSDVRRHYVPEFGRTATHRHLRNCRPVRVDAGPPPQQRDCHRDVRRHYVPGYGRVVHRHVGSNCRIRIFQRYDGRPGGRECVQIGPIRYCIRS